MTLEVPPASSPAVHNVMIANKSTRTQRITILMDSSYPSLVYDLTRL